MSMNTDKPNLILIGWYSDGKLITTHSGPADRLERQIAEKPDYLEVRQALPAYPRLGRTLAAHDALVAAQVSA